MWTMPVDCQASSRPVRCPTAGPVDFKIFGPAGRRALDADDADFPATSRFIDLLFGKQGAFGYLKDFSAPLRFQVNDIDAPATASALPEVHTVFDEGGLRISAVAGHHRDAPAVVYRIDHAGKSITFSGDIDASGLAGSAANRPRHQPAGLQQRGARPTRLARRAVHLAHATQGHRRSGRCGARRPAAAEPPVTCARRAA
jgi:hypothetical protein